MLPRGGWSTLIWPLITLFTLVKELEGLQCFNCGGITNYDPQSCFDPVYGKTIIQECQRGEVCEKKITRVDLLQTVVERGCTSNCDGRRFIWTDTFRVYCCDDDNRCNSARSLGTTHLTTMVAIVTLCWTFIHRQMLCEQG